MRDPLYWVPIRYKLALTFVLLALVSLGTGGAVAYYTAKNALLDQILKNVQVSTTARAANVAAFLESLGERTEDFSSDGFIRDTVKELQEGNLAVQEELNRHLRENKVAIVPDFFETFVVGKAGRVLASSNPASVGRDVSGRPWILKGRTGTHLGEIHDAREGTAHPSLEISAPLTDKDSHAFIGVIVNRVRAESISRVVAGAPPGASKSGAGPISDSPSLDYYLIDDEGTFLSGTRFLSFAEAFLERTAPVPLGGSVALAATDSPEAGGRSGSAAARLRSPVAVESGLREGYRGAEVISAWGGIPGTKWTLVGEVEAREAFRPVVVLRNRLALVGLVLAGLTALLLYFPSKFMIAPIQHLRDAARRVEGGDFDVGMKVNSSDEIGQLGNAFNQMAVGLQERARIEKRLFQHEKMLVIGELSASFAHELNTPLASITMFSQMLLDDAPEGSPQREHLEVIVRNAWACERTVRSLLGHAGKGGGEKSSVDLKECLQEVVGLFGPLLDKSHIRHELDLANDIQECPGDRERLRQVFVNLTMNAIQAMEGGGTLTIKARRARCDESENTVVEFRDTGEGIGLQHMSKVFEPFFTTKPDGVGSGLGLSIARRVVEEHGGHIEVATPPAGGASFVVTLPSAPPAG